VYFKYASIASVVVEIIFSKYKNVLAVNRRLFVFENQLVLLLSTAIQTEVRLNA
jgi:hypothetical protein